MMRQYELVERVLSYDPKADEALLNRAYVYAMKAHGNQKRASGDPYFSHPLEVAAILTDLKLDDATIVTALLHDVIEDTPVTRAEIDQLFGPEIGRLVDGLTKIRRLDLVSKKTEQAENFRKLLVAISSDIRVLLVKLADRVHNMRTIEHMKPESRKRISEETLDIYAPLAARMGMEQVREELEDHAFRWLHPDAYAAVTAKLDELRKTNQGLVEEIRAALAAKLAEVGIDAEVSGREKKPYAIWRKMANKQISLEQLSDIYAFRVITNSIDDCYRVLGVAHTTWRTVPGRFKDYISTPKQNNYQSIHTTIVGPRHQRVELQIRTRMMHEVAEYGVAAHAIYKDASRLNGQAAAQSPDDIQRETGPYAWLRRLVETLLEGSNSEEFLEHTKLELFQDQVFCFTPKGRLIALPHGATPLDFAYAVHTDVGNAAVGAFVNGRHVPIDTQLRNGDEVEIETAKNHTPPAAWENLVITGRARSAIRRAARDAVRRQYRELGRRLVAAQFDRFGEELSDDKLKQALPRLGYKTLDDVLAAVGRNELSIDNVLRAAIPEVVEHQAKKPGYQRTRRFGRATSQDGWFNIDRVMSLKFRGEAADPKAAGGPGPIQHGPGLAIRGVKDDLPVTFEPGGAVPGDRIVGVMIPGEGIRIFQIHSPRLREYEHEGWIDVTWDVDTDTPQRFPARISVTALNEPGTLAQIAKVIGETGGNIDNVRMVRRASDFTEMRIELEVLDLVHLNHIIAGLREKAVVNKVERVFD
ncbi:MAG TPA: bifunctional (p)ppGpp synthetase/guanosine-3',5'-bis(diphosphate) 3'-pyrophosphohydrolase [Hyphomicrobium sp.]|nr:bifunctional (p)ppGpp synthetase/guanosine-3',5'-bis(diphosphate) 3'-pyrophosphohydrolase [Hyphomicrobium sp.]